MSNLIIKPTTGAGNKLIIQDQAGNAVITTGDTLAAMSYDVGGQLQIKQWRKLSFYDDLSSGDSVQPSPFNGDARITLSSAKNWVRARFGNSVDHGVMWRSGYMKMQWSSDNGSTWNGICGASSECWQASTNMHGNMHNLDGIFQPGSASEIRVRIIKNGHTSGPMRRMGRYNAEGIDNVNGSPETANGITSVGHWIILEELAGDICSSADTP